MSKMSEVLGLELGTATVVTEEATEQVKVLAAHMAATATAELNAQLEKVTAELATAQADLAKAQADLDVATTKATTAETELATYKAGIEREAELATLRTEREAAVKAVAPKLLEGEQPEVATRIERWAAMEAATFAAFLGDLQAVATTTTATTTSEKSFSEQTAETAVTKARTTSTNTISATDAARTLLGSI